jgi:hypothetical protein
VKRDFRKDMELSERQYQAARLIGSTSPPFPEKLAR